MGLLRRAKYPALVMALKAHAAHSRVLSACLPAMVAACAGVDSSLDSVSAEERYTRQIMSLIMKEMLIMICS